MAKVLELTELVLVRGVAAGEIFSLLALSLPFFFSMTIPMSTLLAVLLAFLRMSGDGEVTVLKAAGVSLYQLLPPVAVFCAGTMALTGYLTLSLVPAANWIFEQKVVDLAKVRADVSLKERVFNVGYKNMTILVNHMSLTSDLMEDIFIQDERETDVTSVIVAARGRIATDPSQGILIIQLYNGVIDRVYHDMKKTDSTRFDQYELRMSMEGTDGAPSGPLEKNQATLPTPDLFEAAARLKTQNHPHWAVYEMDLHKRFALPLACLVLGLIAVPLGVQVNLKGRNWGIVMGLAVFLAYYVLLTAAWSFGDSRLYPPGLGMWMPNVVIGSLALYMIRQTNRERPIWLIDLFNRWSGWWQERKAKGEAAS
jgi:lipopolysaccharide export system permease protein